MPRAKSLTLPGDAVYDELKQGSGKNKIATTMAVVRLLKDWMKDPEIGQRIVPIAPDEYRTFGMDSMFPSAKVYNPGGQQYESVDRKLLLSYKESAQGQMLHEGISEAGAMASATAAGSAYTTHGEQMIPFYIFYSMFGFQRTGDSIWAMADQLARGFLIGATAGRTTLTGEGLQHADGHSPLLAATNPAVVHYDPAFAYEVAHIMESGLDRMYGRPRRTRTARTSSSTSPSTTSRSPSRRSPTTSTSRGSSRACTEVAKAEGDGPAGHADGLRCRLPVDRRGRSGCWPRTGACSADLWSVTSWNELARNAIAAEEWNLLHPGETPRTAYVDDRLDGAERPGRRGVATTCAPYRCRSRAGCPGDYRVLGADGFGFADTRPAARRFFHIDAAVGRRPGAAGARRRRRDRPRPRSRRRSTSTASTTRPRSPT